MEENTCIKYLFNSFLLKLNYEISYLQLSAVESLCQSPYACDSTLAAKAQHLINSQQDADMIFEIITSQGMCTCNWGVCQPRFTNFISMHTFKF